MRCGCWVVLAAVGVCLSISSGVLADDTPVNWAMEPNAKGATVISMTAVTATDANGVEYYFQNMTDNSHDSGWQNLPTYIDTGLIPDSAYAYRVKSRDVRDVRNETLWSDQRSATTSSYDCMYVSPADLSGNCQVDFFDYALFATAWAYGTPEANLHIDEVLDIRDAAVFAADWFTCGREPADECWSE